MMRRRNDGGEGGKGWGEVYQGRGEKIAGKGRNENWRGSYSSKLRYGTESLLGTEVMNLFPASVWRNQEFFHL